MSRTKTFADFDERQADDVVEILDQSGVTVSVYRFPEQQGNPGFDKELNSQSFLRNILAYLKPIRSQDHTFSASSEAGYGSVTRYLGITMEKDVRVRDIWKFNNKEYFISEIDDSAKPKIEVILERRI